MARILTVAPDEARGPRRLAVWLARRQYGGVVPGIMQILLADLALTARTLWLYGYLHERGGSPLTPLQREMVATVVNGAIGGAP
ncbi:MAG TPA: hypothetical protein VFL91_20315 [Thermomicrobiales bacterium]|nr:hypothetical protein [Thermomicrobiales bacterium]